MRAYIVQSEKRIDPFDEHPRDCLIGNKTLVVLQIKALLNLGLEPVFISNSSQIDDQDEYIFLGDNLYFTTELLDEFIARSRGQGNSTTCALKSGITTFRTATTLQEVKSRSNHVEYSLHYVPEARLRGKYSILVIEPDQFCTSVPMPGHICDSGEYLIPLTERFVVQIDHWVNLWAANIITILAEGARLRKGSKIRIALLVMRALSLNKWKILSRWNKIGQNCDIHPTAYIEGSLIDDGVRIGAGSIVKESIVGKSVFIGNGVTVEESVIGEKSTVLHGHILYSVLYPSVFSVAQMVSASLIGRDSFVGSGVTLTDFRFDRRNVLVLKDGVKIDSGNRFLGSCLGHGVYLGSGCIVAPGRTIPQGMRITPEKNRIISECNPDQETVGFRLIKNK